MKGINEMNKGIESLTRKRIEVNIADYQGLIFALDKKTLKRAFKIRHGRE